MENQEETNNNFPNAEELVQSEPIIEERKKDLKEKAIAWLKNPQNIILLLIILGLVFLRFNYFLLTINQPIWYDEGYYLSAAKYYAGILGDFEMHAQRTAGFPLFIALFFKLGITNEPALRFFINFIPSILVLFALYFLIKEMYSDKRIAIVSLVIFGILWEHLFYSNRFHTENYALIFQFLAILILFKTYMKKEKLFFITPKSSLVWILILVALSYYFRPGNLPYVPSLILFILLLNSSNLTNRLTKTSLLSGIIGLIVASYLFVIYLLPKIPVIGVYYHPELNIAWNCLTVFNGFYGSIVPKIPPLFYYAFFLGLIMILIDIFLLSDRLKNLKRDKEYLNLKSDIFNLILLLSTLFIFIFLIRPEVFEYRWFLIFVSAMVAITSKGIISFSDFIGKLFKSKIAIVILIILITGLGAYTQYVHADQIIKVKIDTYSQIREAGFFIKENSNPEDAVLSRSGTQLPYYSERANYNYYDMNQSEFFDLIKDRRPKFMFESGLEPNAAIWGLDPPENVKHMLNPVNIWFNDPEQTQPIAILYEVNPDAEILNQSSA
jgi:hypothetical protein